MGRPSNATVRRSQISTALLRVMATDGYGGATVASVAAEAGLAPGLIHYHFASKQEILLAAIGQLSGYLRQRYAERATTAATPAARLRAFVDARLAKGEGADAEAVAAWVVIAAEAVRQPEVKAAFQAAVREQRTVLTQLLRDYANSQVTPTELEHLAAIVLAAMEGAFQLSISAGRVMPQNYAAPVLMALIERFVGYPQSRRSSKPASKRKRRAAAETAP
jgi:TetR/AcrR family transcriptional regulator, transcriptional repressor of bet genes